ncbi:hypothetical protein DYB35_004706 [Aphanomyces astaci]|uniref:protein O-GlcNAc transferase n=1 Tax=Aphanomyces astaci TaxID=112090 RepID=A0A3R6WVS0_APHAT|nr:hypothetical protein DYB35_004706 [Aphanomyces astaci]
MEATLRKKTSVKDTTGTINNNHVLEPLQTLHQYAGNALKEIGDSQGAIQFYLRAIKLNPRFADVYNNLATSYMQLGATHEAIETYKMALVLGTSSIYTFILNLGNLYKAQGLFDDATTCFTNAIRVKPTFAIAWSNLAGLLKDEGQLDKAIDHYKEAIRLAPDFADAYSNLGNISCYRTALRLKPDHPYAYNNLGNALKDKGMIKEAIHCYMTAARLMPRFAAAHCNLGRYVSSNFGNHPLSHLMQSVFGLHDSKRIEVTCYATSSSDQSQWRRKIEADAEHFKDLSAMTTGDAARLIHNDGIHILVNLNGYTKGARTEIFALRPAPIQVSLMGFHGSMGAEYMQYIVADKIVLPVDVAAVGYTEKVLYMPQSFFVNDHKQSALSVLDVRNWETAMLLAWSGHDAGMPLDHIDVPDIEDLVAC